MRQTGADEERDRAEAQRVRQIREDPREERGDDNQQAED